MDTENYISLYLLYLESCLSLGLEMDKSHNTRKCLLFYIFISMDTIRKPCSSFLHLE